MKLLTVDTVESALQKLLVYSQSLRLSVERLKIPDALGRIVAEDIVSPEDIPGFRRSTVDGYAVVSADTAGASESLPVFLRLAGLVEMGKAADFSLGRGQCAAVPTGGMIPQGADAVVMEEYSEHFDENSIAIYESAALGSRIAQTGEDVRQGSLLLRRGTKIRSQEAGVLAAVGIVEVPVYVPLRLSLISTGDELVSPADTPGPGQVRDINTWALAALAARSGYRIAACQTVRDEGDALEKAIRGAMEHSDVVCLSGGSSQGAKDMTAAIFSRLARPGVFCHGLAIKPGKPTILGFDEQSATILAGLPGHPVSALMVFRSILSPLVHTLSGQSEAFPIPAEMTRNLAGSPGRASYQPVKLLRTEAGYFAEPVFGKSGMISVLTQADGYVIIDLNKEGLQKGEAVWVYLWEDA